MALREEYVFVHTSYISDYINISFYSRVISFHTSEHNLMLGLIGENITGKEQNTKLRTNLKVKEKI